MFFISSANILNKDIKFGSIDCTSNYEECNKLVTKQKYPAVKYYSNGLEFPYLLFKEFEYDSIIKWAIRSEYTINKSITNLMTADQIKNLNKDSTCAQYSPITDSSSLKKAPLATILLILIHFLKF
jgi:hypothetical protein